MTQSNPYTPRTYEPPSRPSNPIQHYTVLAVIVLCTIISLLLADSLLGVWRIELDQPVPGGWQWLVGNAVQTFRTQTIALITGAVLMGFSLGGVWFLLAVGYRALRRLF